MNEGLIDLRVVSGKPAGWRSATFNSNGTIASGSNIWFGIFCEYYWLPRFDYGARCYADWWDHLPGIPNTYPIWNVSNFSNFKLSMYFTYTAAQNYVRTLTQGVRLSDSRKHTANYKRSVIQAVSVNSALARFQTFFRMCVMTVRNTVKLNRYPIFFRAVIENIKVTFIKYENRTIIRKCLEYVKINVVNKRIHNVIRHIQEIIYGFDSQNISIVYLRSVADETMAKQKFSHWGAFVRGLPITAGSTAETAHGAAYYRIQTDTVHAEGSVFRGLLLFVKIISQVFIRDYLLSRFFKARQELVLKSCVCREIILESKIG
jgi:hypothetical protein